MNLWPFSCAYLTLCKCLFTGCRKHRHGHHPKPKTLQIKPKETAKEKGIWYIISLLPPEISVTERNLIFILQFHALSNFYGEYFSCGYSPK
jgi:hypothetical protein